MQRRKRSLKTKITLGLVLVCVLISAGLFVLSLLREDMPPEISFPEVKISLSLDDIREITALDYSCLLDDVTVYDDQDGDISDRVIVKSYWFSDDFNYAIITYQATDQNGNSATKKRVIYFEQEVYDSTIVGPVLSLTTDTIETTVGVIPDLANYIEELSDNKDSYESLVASAQLEGEADFTEPGEYEMSVYVVDSDGNASDVVYFTVIVE